MYLKINKIKEQKDGSALIDIEYDKEVSDLALKHYKRKRVTKKLMERFVIEGLKNYMDKEKK